MELQTYWQNFFDGLPPDFLYRARPMLAEGWGDSPAMADELDALIAN